MEAQRPKGPRYLRRTERVVGAVVFRVPFGCNPSEGGTASSNAPLDPAVPAALLENAGTPAVAGVPGGALGGT
jgi:hypothetical protein